MNFSRADRFSRIHLAAAVAGVLALLGLAALWRQSRPVVHTTTVTTTPSPDSVSSTDCPDTARCALALARPAVVSAARAAFPSAQLVTSWRIEDGQGRGYGESVRLKTSDGVIVVVSARCVPGGDVVPDRVIGPAPAAGPAVTSTVVGGPRGCSVAVTTIVPDGVPVPANAASALAHTPSLQLI